MTVRIRQWREARCRLRRARQRRQSAELIHIHSGLETLREVKLKARLAQASLSQLQLQLRDLSGAMTESGYDYYRKINKIPVPGSKPLRT